MSAPSTAALVRRIVQEHRTSILAVGIALAANVLVYALVVYPMADRVANIERTSQEAQNDLRTARGEYERANGMLTGKDKAAQELSTFYSTVLPKGFVGARRLTTLKLLQLARQNDLDAGGLSAQPVVSADSTLRQLRLQMDLAGSYANMRSFIHQLEVSPDFVVIDNISLREGADDGGTLVVNLELSTYYRDTP
jgi:Tfp pilus assembly protein PilO